MSQLSIVVTCTDRKASPPAERLRVRNLPQGDVAERVAEWGRRLDTAADPRPLTELYKGDHWVRSLRLPASAAQAGFTAELWVASAGLGLQPVSASAPAYAATFTSRHEDSVGGTFDERGTWWHHLQEERGASRLTDLACKGPILLVLSEVYAAAIETELQALAAIGGEALLIGGARDLPGLTRLPADGSLRSALGGTLTSLNVRMAAWWLEHCSGARLTQPDTSAAWNDWVAQASKKERYHRAPMTDERVISFIRESVAQNPVHSRTRLLRMLRDQGLACEQKRFADLYAATVGKNQ
ncbi:hypothetical protein [Streptomyces sporangiiformans]|uniref:Uncharacterized protein n=1 Tax=Streptomyces sporangiiformans TaxID=2315329 RepID=A0A505DDH4_9ACTN|nr:hypothetical protein [Streptomyces sporangiiformans]TPQ18628.1 hypothetical protein FGD71_030210 [Streptomyces sporangiiformans]